MTLGPNAQAAQDRRLARDRELLHPEREQMSRPATPQERQQFAEMIAEQSVRPFDAVVNFFDELDFLVPGCILVSALIGNDHTNCIRCDGSGGWWDGFTPTVAVNGIIPCPDGEPIVWSVNE